MTQDVIVRHRGEQQRCALTDWHTVADDMIGRLGPWVPGESQVIPLPAPDATAPRDDEQPTGEPTAYTAKPADFPVPAAPAPERRFSDWGEGKQVTDEVAKTRIEGMHADLNAALGAGTVDSSKQLYGTGTRMAQVGYETQQSRKDEFLKLEPLRDVAARFTDQVRQEQRRDLVIRADDLAKKLAINGKLTFDGYAMRDHAVRGLLARLGSPATRYVVGLKERIANPAGDLDPTPPPTVLAAWKQADKDALLDVLIRECKRFGGTKLKLRTRDGLRDVFATVSPDYVAADAPAVLGDLLAALPHDARGAYTYDAKTTSWQFRASVFTPTPVQEQAVGEPFEGYAAFNSADGGQSTLGGGGGLLLLACLNAMVYGAATSDVRRIHRGRILRDLRAMSRKASEAIAALVAAWGKNRATVIEPKNDDAKLISIEEAIPGFYRHMLTARRGELVGVLPGRSEKHVTGLASAYISERRDRKQILRADLANGWTRYTQTQPAPIQRDAERAIGAWLTSEEPVRYLAQ